MGWVVAAERLWWMARLVRRRVRGRINFWWAGKQ